MCFGQERVNDVNPNNKANNNKDNIKYNIEDTFGENIKSTARENMPKVIDFDDNRNFLFFLGSGFKGLNGTQEVNLHLPVTPNMSPLSLSNLNLALLNLDTAFSGP